MHFELPQKFVVSCNDVTTILIVLFDILQVLSKILWSGHWQNIIYTRAATK